MSCSPRLVPSRRPRTVWLAAWLVPPPWRLTSLSIAPRSPATTCSSLTSPVTPRPSTAGTTTLGPRCVTRNTSSRTLTSWQRLRRRALRPASPVVPRPAWTTSCVGARCPGRIGWATPTRGRRSPTASWRGWSPDRHPDKILRIRMGDTTHPCGSCTVYLLPTTTPGGSHDHVPPPPHLSQVRCHLEASPADRTVNCPAHRGRP